MLFEISIKIDFIHNQFCVITVHAVNVLFLEIYTSVFNQYRFYYKKALNSVSDCNNLQVLSHFYA